MFIYAQYLFGIEQSRVIRSQNCLVLNASIDFVLLLITTEGLVLRFDSDLLRL